MTRSDAELIRDAGIALGVTPLDALTPGFQKLVWLGKLGSDDVVLKVVRLNVSPESQSAVLARAHREVELLRSIDHANVVRAATEAVELGSGPEAVCWAEEHLPGDDLRDLLQGPWSPDDCKTMMLEVARGLAELHSRDVVHRDLSLGNVRRTTSGTFKIIDPGFARHLNRSLLTAVGQPGTFGHMSPEHVDINAAPVPASDVFAVGILGYVALTGGLPLVPADPAAYASTLREDDMPSVAQAASSTPAGLVAVIDTCLQRQLARRYFDGAELVSALEAL